MEPVAKCIGGAFSGASLGTACLPTLPVACDLREEALRNCALYQLAVHA